MDTRMTDRETRWADLFRRACGGDRQAYAAFLTEAAPVIRRIVASRGIPGATAEVEDMVQDVLLALHAKRHTWRDGEPITPWLYAIARYKAVDGWRRRGRPAVDIDDLAEVLADPAGGDVTARRDVDRLLGALDPRSAQIVRAMSLDGDSAGQVGARLGMTEGAVRVALHRAMSRLRLRARGSTAADATPEAEGRE
jgi:RNA polymerase sigma-70 factor (ECF subfamily)